MGKRRESLTSNRKWIHEFRARYDPKCRGSRVLYRHPRRWVTRWVKTARRKMRRITFHTAWDSPRAAAAAAANGRTNRRTRSSKAPRAAANSPARSRVVKGLLRRQASHRIFSQVARHSRMAVARRPSVGRRSFAIAQRSPENPGNQASAGGFANGNGAGYRDKDSHQPGNSAGGFKRKGKQQTRAKKLRRPHGP